MAKKYYWLKLKEDFFNDPDIKLIKSQKDGKDYLILYLQLQLISLRSEGILRHKDVIPYTAEMLATLTDMPLGTVNMGIKLFTSLGMIEQWDDGTLYMLEMQKLIGHESESAERVRQHRKHKKALALQCNNEVTKSNTEKEKEKEKEINKEKKQHWGLLDSFSDELRSTYKDFITMRSSIKKPMTKRSLTMLINSVDKLADKDDIKIKILEQSIFHNWQTVYELKEHAQQERKVADF